MAKYHMQRSLVFAAFILAVSGCDREPAPPLNVSSSAEAIDHQVPLFDAEVSADEIPEVYAEAVRYDNEDYAFVGVVRDHDHLADGYEYRRGDRQRLLLLTKPLNSEVLAWMARPQILDGEEWLDDGQQLARTVDGQLDASEHVQGELHGWSRSWYPGGRLHVETPYVHGVRQGVGRGWYESGAKQYAATYANDQEIDGVSWREDGTVR
jgi:hypothetical protein